MTDTHTHMYMPDAYPDGGVEATQRAIDEGVTRLIFPCVTYSSLAEMERLHRQFPDNTRLGIGLHPTELEGDWEGELSRMEALLPGEFCAIGEVGIDLYHDASDVENQKLAFARQLKWAQQYNLPVIIHCREGLNETLDVLSHAEGELPTLIFHSFTGTKEDVRRIREVCDPWFGINGVVTFKNAPTLREALPEIGLNRILLETDSPWLSPAPKRGQQNESSRIRYIRDCVADVLGLTPEEVETATDNAAAKIFHESGKWKVES